MFAQNNLVLNGNFESYFKCPPQRTNSYTETFLSYWQSANSASPDYYNECSPYNVSGSVHIPNSSTGYQYAISGKGYSGFLFCGKYTNLREYIIGKLKRPLSKDSTYQINFFISTADNSKNAIDRIGAYLSKDSIFEQDYYKVLPYNPQIESDSGVILDYRTEWHEIKGLYKAHGGEKYITLGSFVSWDSLNWKTYNPPTYIGEGAYYYIDSVSVRLYKKPDTIIPPKTPNYTLYPNPAKDEIRIDFTDITPKTITLELYDAVGRKVFERKSTAEGSRFRAVVSTLPPGVYAYRLWVDGNVFGRGKIVVFE